MERLPQATSSASSARAETLNRPARPASVVGLSRCAGCQPVCVTSPIPGRRLGAVNNHGVPQCHYVDRVDSTRGKARPTWVSSRLAVVRRRR